MLTPVDIQQKKFKTGIGFNKDDVNQFFHEVSVSYEELYRSNADLKEKVITMTDTLQHYKATEDNLQKSLLIAEKNTEEQKTNAQREARNIEAEARSRANEIVKDAQAQLEYMEKRMEELRDQYAEYKQQFADLMRANLRSIGEWDFDAEAQVREKEPPKQEDNFGFGGLGGMDGDFGFQFSDSPARDTGSGSGLGGAGSVGSSREERRSSATNVYGSVLGGEGIDPFSGM